MGIYTRDQIQYANMIHNAMQNRARAIEREGDRINQTGAIWGSAARDVGNKLSDLAMAYGNYQMDNEKMKAQQEFQASEALKRAAEQKAAQEAQRKWQEEQNTLNRAYTAEENALNRMNAMELAKLSRQDSDDDRLMNLERSNQILASKRAILETDPNNKKLIEDYNNAAWMANKYGSKYADYKPVEYISFDNLGRDNATAENLIRSELAKKVPWTNARREELFEVIADIGDQKIVDTLTSEIMNKKTVEEIAAKRAALKAKYDKMTPHEQREWKKNNPDTAKALGI